jgi:hypothetical protein
MSKGLKGTKTILLTSITGIQYKEPGLTNGYLQFTISGGNESKGGVLAAASDENTVMFAKAVNAQMLEVKSFIEKRIIQAKQPQASSSGPADEIKKLAALREQGLLSNDEFSQAKRKLLGL